MGKLQVEITTPERQVYSGLADMLTALTTEGTVGILPGHLSLFSRLVPGELKINRGGSDEFFAVTGGFLDVHHDRITVLADTVLRSEEIDQAASLLAKERAEKIKKESRSREEFAQAENSIRRALLEIKVAQRKRKHSELPHTST